MKADREIRRRQFLKTTTGAVALAGLAGAGAAVNDTSPASRSHEALDQLAASMESKRKELYVLPRQDGQFLSLMVKTSQAKNALEIGTSHGFSAIWLGLGLEATGGKLTTVEILPDRIEVAKKQVADAGLSPLVTFKQGDAHKILPTLEGPFDFVLLRADKEGQVDYFNTLYPKKLLPGGLLLAYNAIRQADKMQDYLDLVGKHPEFDSIILSLTMEDGFSVSYRRRR